jgi:hypothetical protein
MLNGFLRLKSRDFASMLGLGSFGTPFEPALMLWTILHGQSPDFHPRGPTTSPSTSSPLHIHPPIHPSIPNLPTRVDSSAREVKNACVCLRQDVTLGAWAPRWPSHLSLLRGRSPFTALHDAGPLAFTTAPPADRSSGALFSDASVHSLIKLSLPLSRSAADRPIPRVTAPTDVPAV